LFSLKYRKVNIGYGYDFTPGEKCVPM
jgi:hypothetical protein